MTCDTCKHWRFGCTLSESRLDGRGEPTMGHPQACGYFEGVPVDFKTANGTHRIYRPNGSEK